MVEIEGVNDDINDDKLLFIGSSQEKLDFNTFNKPLNFISAIYNGETSLKEAEFSKKKLGKKQKIYNLTINQKMKKKEKK